MQIGINCFEDEQLYSMITSAKRYGDCEIEQKSNCLVYDTDKDRYLEEYFEEILDVFTVAKHINIEITDNRVDYLNKYLKKWYIFSVGEENLQKIIKAICTERYKVEPELFEEKVTIKELFSVKLMEQKCILKNYNWDFFCNSIKYINRFHLNQFNFNQFKILLENMVVDIPKSTLTLFRSRICDEENYFSGYPIEKMGVPPVSLTTAGRTNSEGIQCLYLSNDIPTTFHEVRARDNDHVSVGRFVQTEDLKIVDLSLFDKIGPFDVPDFDMTWFAINIEIIRKIGNEIAKPMRRFDKDLDYVPTQYICDYIKYLGYDGIRFKSTLSSSGINYAVFDEKKFVCESITVAEIEKIEYFYSQKEACE